MICAMLTYFYPNADLALKVGYVASIASKLSDTLGSELVLFSSHLLLLLFKYSFISREKHLARLRT